jgi:hypothetical protein
MAPRLGDAALVSGSVLGADLVAVCDDDLSPGSVVELPVRVPLGLERGQPGTDDGSRTASLELSHERGQR